MSSNQLGLREVWYSLPIPKQLYGGSMRRTLSVICLLACVAIALPIIAQQKSAAADSVSGTWTGDWGPNAADRNQVSVDLKLNAGAVTGTVHSVTPKRDDVAITKGTYTAAGNKVHLEAEAKS